MDRIAPLIADPVKLLRHLDESAIRERLDNLDRERQALLVLLRAVCRVNPRKSTSREGVTHD
jgi:hypothetical protein